MDNAATVVLTLRRKVNPLPQYVVLPCYDLTLNPPTGSIYILVAKHEYHGTTAVSSPNRLEYCSRIKH